MADNNPHTPEPVDEKRWGGPGSSHQNAKADRSSKTRARVVPPIRATARYRAAAASAI